MALTKSFKQTVQSRTEKEPTFRTKSFKETVQARAEREPEFRIALLNEAVNEFLAGDLKASKALLRNYVNTSLSFKKLAKALDKNDKSLQRMLGPDGNPTTSNFCALLRAIQKVEGIKLEVRIH